eukprot:scpid93226/ scgid33786/ 
MGSWGSSLSGSKGSNYEAVVFFLDYGSTSSSCWTVHDNQLRESLGDLIAFGSDYAESITEIERHKNPLVPWLPEMGLFYHEFIVFQTKNWWWSIEKNSEGVTLQRSKQRGRVLLYRGKTRGDSVEQTHITTLASDSVYPLQEFVGLLYCSDVVGSQYNLPFNNCQSFASTVYTKIIRRELPTCF